MASVLGVLTTPDATVGAIRALRDAGFDDLDAYSPIPSHEIEEVMERGKSGVRAWTLAGGLFGVTAGYALTIGTAYDWEIITGWKPFASIPAYTIIAFEFTILFGAILTVLGLLVHGMAMSRPNTTAYRPSFSAGEFGCLVNCQPDQIRRVQELLASAGSREVRVVDA